MCDPHNLHQTDRDSSTETESTDHIIMPGDASNSMGDVEILKTKKVKVLEEIEIESPDPDLDHVEEEKEMKEKE
ncbi:hypothetical protein COLO4_24486 [Corchorus olitorius]|uniref:Uncharacterized protein n=1 Tax=Corchorus olitorius TaxID=93759 RepID=A0A1R3I9N0_9ROSI|nr:hypothetical protein COLO4_24486 [Corchorus olitorius]